MSDHQRSIARIDLQWTWLRTVGQAIGHSSVALLVLVEVHGLKLIRQLKQFSRRLVVELRRVFVHLSHVNIDGRFHGVASIEEMNVGLNFQPIDTRLQTFGESKNTRLRVQVELKVRLVVQQAIGDD